MVKSEMRARTVGAWIVCLAFAAGCGGSAVNTDGGSDANQSDASDSAVADGSDAPPADVPGDVPGDATPRVPLNHRTSDSACSSTPPPGDCHFGGGGGPGSCTADSDCSSGTNGRCILEGGGVAFCGCTYDTCSHDSDCTMGGPCACHGTPYAGGQGNTCVPGNCRVDSDCGPGGFCSPTQSLVGCGGLGGFYCHTPNDQCIDDSDCNGSGTGPQVCAYQTSTGRWECVVQHFCA